MDPPVEVCGCGRSLRTPVWRPLSRPPLTGINKALISASFSPCWVSCPAPFIMASGDVRSSCTKRGSHCVRPEILAASTMAGYPDMFEPSSIGRTYQGGQSTSGGGQRSLGNGGAVNHMGNTTVGGQHQGGRTRSLGNSGAATGTHFFRTTQQSECGVCGLSQPGKCRTKPCRLDKPEDPLS